MVVGGEANRIAPLALLGLRFPRVGSIFGRLQLVSESFPYSLRSALVRARLSGMRNGGPLVILVTDGLASSRVADTGDTVVNHTDCVRERWPTENNYDDSARRCFLLRSLSSAIVSLVPFPLGRDIQGLMPSPMTKMFVTLQRAM